MASSLTIKSELIGGASAWDGKEDVLVDSEYLRSRLDPDTGKERTYIQTVKAITTTKEGFVVVHSILTPKDG